MRHKPSDRCLLCRVTGADLDTAKCPAPRALFEVSGGMYEVGDGDHLIQWGQTLATLADASDRSSGVDRLGNWMRTFSGRRIYLEDPRPEDIAIEDIAHHLANICRFGGATKRHYSVAEHSVRVADYVRDNGGTKAAELHALLHDASEAYLGDVVWPLKRSDVMLAYRGLERRWEMAIEAKFGLATVLPLIVKRGDLVLLATEKRDLCSGDPAVTLEADEAARALNAEFDVKPLREQIPVTRNDYFPLMPEADFLWRFKKLVEAAP